MIDQHSPSPETDSQADELAAKRARRTRRVRQGIFVFATLILVTGVAGVFYAAPIANGFCAKLMCSQVFLSGREPDDVLAEDLEDLSMCHITIDREHKRVSSSLLGLTTTAVYRPGLGSTLVLGAQSAESLQAQTSPKQVKEPVSKAWPFGEGVPPEIDAAKLKAAIDKAFEEPFENSPRRTRAVVVLYKGRLVAERYAPKIDKAMPLIGWSMTKSVTAVLMGILVKQGKIDIHKSAPVPEWSRAGDPRGKITVHHLLQMTSGLKWKELYFSPFSDVTYMLFRSGNTAHSAASLPLQFEPGTHWQYSSGTTNILMRIIQQSSAKERAAQRRFPHEQLFEPLGMSSAVIESDAEGTMVGSSYMYATARDWARFGLFTLQNGRWRGRQILPKDWMEYCLKPVVASRGYYGAQFWINTGPKDDPWKRQYARLPQDTYLCRGFNGQYVVMVPSKQLVLVRMGQTKRKTAFSIQNFVNDVLKSFKESGQ